mmetsp:Transcript_9625/g.32074  ORF Transcript_9625/g.32074 Transcript_9625/m.32074 type:complete len:210 (-) Transcript_9625:145-774(-)
MPPSSRGGEGGGESGEQRRAERRRLLARRGGVQQRLDGRLGEPRGTGDWRGAGADGGAEALLGQRQAEGEPGRGGVPSLGESEQLRQQRCARGRGRGREPVPPAAEGGDGAGLRVGESGTLFRRDGAATARDAVRRDVTVRRRAAAVGRAAAAGRERRRALRCSHRPAVRQPLQGGEHLSEVAGRELRAPALRQPALPRVEILPTTSHC